MTYTEDKVERLPWKKEESTDSRPIHTVDTYLFYRWKQSQQQRKQVPIKEKATFQYGMYYSKS